MCFYGASYFSIHSFGRVDTLQWALWPPGALEMLSKGLEHQSFLVSNTKDITSMSSLSSHQGPEELLTGCVLLNSCVNTFSSLAFCSLGLYPTQVPWVLSKSFKNTEWPTHLGYILLKQARISNKLSFLKTFCFLFCKSLSPYFTQSVCRGTDPAS